jgi:DNA (cytosine-5)-methyltransferase 1
MLTLGSFFDGVGTWQLSATKAGINPVWCSEIDDFPATVSAHHFPKTKQLGDITKIDVNELEPVDIICAGSPCQDLSVAGKREGLGGERSGLFRTAIKLVHGLRERTGKPRYFVWENVPGAFSSNKGNDFRAVLEEITKAEIPMPKDNKWADSGMVEWNGGSLAWRVLDAQGWGVPQRRRRIFLVADFDGRSAGEILFIEQGLHGYSSESKRTRKEAATDVGTSIDSASETLTPWDVQSNRIQSIDGKAATLYGGAGQGTHNGAVFDTRQIDSASGFKYRQGAKAGGIGWQNVKAPTLELSQNCAVYESHPSDCRVKGPIKISPACTVKWRKGSADTPLVACYDMTHADEVMRPVTGDKSNCLNSRMGTGGNQVPVVHCLNDQGGRVMDVSEEKTGTLRAEAHGHAPIIHSYCIAGNTIDRQPQNGGNGAGNQEELAYTLNTVDRHVVAVDVRNLRETEEVSGTLQAKKTGGYSLNYQNPVRVGSLCAHDGRGFNGQDVEKNKIVYPAGKVRRLTPTECERLQGLPDGYTDIEFNGKPAPDSKRYKAIGNGMAVPCSDFIMRRIAEVSNGQNEGHD